MTTVNSTTNDTANKNELQSQFASRAYDGYKNRAQEFTKTFTLLLAFSTIFLLLIQVPYTLIKSQQVTLDAQLAAVNTTSRQIDQKARLYAEVSAGIATLHGAMRQGPDKLRSKIRELAELDARPQAQSNIQAQQQQQQQQQSTNFASPRCANVQRDQWLSCEVEIAVSSQFSEFQNILTRNIVNPLQKLAAAGEGVDTQSVTKGLTSLQSEFWKILQANREFWVTFSGKVQFFDQLDNQVSRFWKTHGADIEKKARQLEVELEKLRTERARLQDNKDQLTKSVDAVEKRISSIESPFGKLPVGMAESIALYPLIIAFGFAIAAVKLVSAMKLRREIFAVWRSQDPNKLVLSDEQISLMAPLALAPAPDGRLSAGKLLLLLLPLAMYIVACLLIFHTWGAGVKEEELMSGLKPIYGTLYVVTAVIMAVSYWKILNRTRLVNKK